MTNKLVHLTSVPTIAEAYMIKARLAQEGIEVFIFDDQMVSFNWLYTQALGGVRVMVVEADLAVARDILSLPVAELSDYIPLDVCPRCGSSNVTQKKTPTALVAAIYLIFHFFFMRHTKRRLCNDCGHCWTQS